MKNTGGKNGFCRSTEMSPWGQLAGWCRCGEQCGLLCVLGAGWAGEPPGAPPSTPATSSIRNSDKMINQVPVWSWQFWGNGLPFMASRKTHLWVRSQENDKTTIPCLDGKPHTDSKRQLIYCVGEKGTLLLSSEPAEGLLLEIPRLPSAAGMFWQGQHRSASPPAGGGMPVFKALCFVLVTSNPFLVNNFRISKKTRAKILTKHDMLSKRHSENGNVFSEYVRNSHSRKRWSKMVESSFGKNVRSSRSGRLCQPPHTRVYVLSHQTAPAAQRRAVDCSAHFWNHSYFLLAIVNNNQKGKMAEMTKPSDMCTVFSLWGGGGGHPMSFSPLISETTCVFSSQRQRCQDITGIEVNPNLFLNALGISKFS